MPVQSVDPSEALPLAQARIEQANEALFKANRALHDNPELCFQEYKAHDLLANFLEDQGFPVTRKAWGLDTCFESSFGSGGREVVICAEYDALPEIGHACGHNLIATSSLAAFLGAAHILSELKLPGRVRVLGTPAEEGAGGKLVLLEAGAFKSASAAVMSHAVAAGTLSDNQQVLGSAAFNLIASLKFRVEFHGRSAHAAGAPWEGVNALDAAVAAYNNVSMLRQHIRTDERIHGVFEEAGTVPNVIPDYTRMNWFIRSPTTQQGELLRKRVEACIEAGAKAANCTFNYIKNNDYHNVVGNKTVCETYSKMMGLLGHKVLAVQEKPLSASTDMGNVSHALPAMHGAFCIPTTPAAAALHTTNFASAAGTEEAHKAAIECGKGMAMVAFSILNDDELAEQMQLDFQSDFNPSK